MPVICIGQVDAQACVDGLRRTTGEPYRLPSEAAWEHAARAGGTGIYPWNGNVEAGCACANLYDKAGRRAVDFGWGFADCHQETYDATPSDGTALPGGPECRLYAVRSGGWTTRPTRQRLTFRGRDPRDTHYNCFGFRAPPRRPRRRRRRTLSRPPCSLAGVPGRPARASFWHNARRGAR